MEKSIAAKVRTIRTELFEYRIEAAIQKTSELLEAMLRRGSADPGELRQVAAVIMRAVEDKDYLLLADVVHYEIPPLWTDGEEGMT